MVTKTFTRTLSLISFFTLVACYDKSKIYTNKWLVQINGGSEEADRLAQKHGFVNEGRVVSTYFTFSSDKVQESSSSPSSNLGEGLLKEDQVIWLEQQTFKTYQLYSEFDMPFDDPSSCLQWYINSDDANNYNVKEVWRMNYTGAGIVVAVVDEGLNTTHPELIKNYDGNASRDFVDNDFIPEPSNTFIMSGHGSKCAGIIAAEGNNGHCGVGLAFNARIGGIRLFKNKMATDETEAKALGFKPNYIDIYSNSWGPGDKGFEVKGPGKATEYILEDGAKNGRLKKGSIFVFAAGNGGVLSKDSCAYNGYVNSIYTIAITSVTRDGSIPFYGERCPGIMATAYSRDSFGDRNPVVTAGDNGQCEFYFGGSSAAAAMASGLIALTLEANKTLDWRDLQHIITRSARFSGRYPSDMVTNGAGLNVSNYMGFGLMDAHKMVKFAEKWKSVPDQRKCEILDNSYTGNDRKLDLTSYWPAECGERISFLEHVQVRVNLKVWPRGDLLLSLESPDGTLSRLTQHRPYDRFPGFSNNLTDWVILTLHHWGENPKGTWKLKAHLRNGIHGDRSLELINWSLILYGTTLDPLKDNPHVYSRTLLSKKPDQTLDTTGYVVEIITNNRNRNQYMDTPPLRNDTKIVLFGEGGKTRERKLTPSGRSSQLYCISDSHVGNLTKVNLIRGRNDRSTYYIKEVAIRQDGNNPWIVLEHDNSWSSSDITIKRACQKGFTRDDKDECVDINECDIRNGDCPQTNGKCVNTHGGYYCKCETGFQLREFRYRSYDRIRRRWFYKSSKICRDINECDIRNDDCPRTNGKCVNTGGSYYCKCDTGFQLLHKSWHSSYDRIRRRWVYKSSKICSDINECHIGISGCSHTCQNNPGSYRCTCPNGLQLSRDHRRCTCPTGFELSHDQRKCLDCIRVGSWFWGLWTKKDNSNNYFRARITTIEDNHIGFYLEVNKTQIRRYNKTNPVLIIDKIPAVSEVSINKSVIAVHKEEKQDWYRTGTVKSIGTASNGAFQALVKFDNGDERLAELNELRLVKRPQVCMDNI